MQEQLFDSWPDQYDAWFRTPIGALVKRYEEALVLDMLKPGPGDQILDVGCGSGVFTEAFVGRGAGVVGMDICTPMLADARRRMPGTGFAPVVADMRSLPLGSEMFDKTISITALEFIEDGRAAVAELFRVTRRNGLVVIATLNSLSPWAERRRGHARDNDDSLFRSAVFRSPCELAALAPVEGSVRTAIHFEKSSDVIRVPSIEARGARLQLATGAFVIGCWRKP